MNNYQQPKKEEVKEPVKKVTSGVSVRKKSGLAKIKDSFFEDAPKVKDHIIFEVFIPAAKKFIIDTVYTFLFGESAPANSKKRPLGTKVSYRDYYDDPVRPSGKSRMTTSRSAFDLDDFEFDERGVAEDVLYQMDKIIDKYGLVSVATLYDICDMTPDNPCVNNYGWTDLRTAHVVRVSGGGYIIRFPKPYPLD